MIRHEVGKKKLHATGLQTLLDLISNEINSLPLGYSYHTDENNTSSLRIITPNFFKLGRNNARTISGPVRLPNNGGELVKNVQDLYKAIFKTWSEVYVPKMMYRPTKFKTGSEDDKLSEGDVVLFQKTDDKLGTVAWTLGIVDEIIVSRDGKARRAIVKYQNADEYIVNDKQVRITQRLTDRAVRSLVKIYDVHDYIIEEDFGLIADKLKEGATERSNQHDGDDDSETDGNSAHHAACQLRNADTDQVYPNNELTCGFLLMSSLLSGQSGEQSPEERDGRRPENQHVDIEGHEAGDCLQDWPDEDSADLCSISQATNQVWMFASRDLPDGNSSNDVTELLRNTNVIIANTSF